MTRLSSVCYGRGDDVKARRCAVSLIVFLWVREMPSIWRMVVPRHPECKLGSRSRVSVVVRGR